MYPIRAMILDIAKQMTSTKSRILFAKEMMEAAQEIMDQHRPEEFGAPSRWIDDWEEEKTPIWDADFQQQLTPA